MMWSRVFAGVLVLGAVGMGAGPAAAVKELTLREAVASLPVALERRDGYSRKAFRHWIDADKDGCSTRATTRRRADGHRPAALTRAQAEMYIPELSVFARLNSQFLHRAADCVQGACFELTHVFRRNHLFEGADHAGVLAS